MPLIKPRSPEPLLLVVAAIWMAYSAYWHYFVQPLKPQAIVVAVLCVAAIIFAYKIVKT